MTNLRFLFNLAFILLICITGNGQAIAMLIDAPLVYDGESRDNGSADGTFDSVSTAFTTADARIQNQSSSFEIEDRIIMEFDLTGIVAGSVISASLMLNELFDDGTPEISLFGDAGDGIATTADAEISNLLTGHTGNFGNSIADIAVIDVTAFINDLLIAGESFSLFAIHGGGGGSLSYRITTSEAGTGPVLRLTTSNAVPEPAILYLLSFGLVGLGFTRRRKKA